MQETSLARLLDVVELTRFGHSRNGYEHVM
jgi:hypothetical protein